MSRILASLATASFLVTAVSPPVHAEASWSLQAPRPTGVDLEAVFLVSPTEAWIAGHEGALLHTTDAGVDAFAWNDRTSSAFPDPFWSVSFSSAARGCAVGNVIRLTTNGGATWGPTAGGPFGTLYSVDLLNATSGWACGGGGVIARTTNGGASWANQTVPTSENLIAIDFVDANHGWAVGGNGTIVATTNGGVTWTLQTSGTETYFASVTFVSSSEGWAAGGDVVLHTTNGGTTWTPQTIPTGTWASDIQFVDASNGWAVGFLLSIIRTTNGGVTWTRVHGGLGASDYDRFSFNEVHFADTMHGIAVGGGGTIYGTEDGGLTWSPRQNGSVDSGRVFALDAQRAWTDGEVCYTEDGGTHWTRTGQFATDLVFTDPLNGWLCLKAGTPPLIRRTTDGGRNWFPLPNAPNHSWRSIDTVDGVTIVVGGWNGNQALLARSNDGGDTWVISPPLISSIIEDVDMVTPTIGYAVGHNAAIFKTTNAGATWSTQGAANAVGAIQSVSFADANNGWCVGGLYNFELTHIIALHTTNGGLTWTVQPLRPNSEGGLWSVCAVDANVAWAGGVEDYLSRTTNGGQTWVRQATTSHPYEYRGVTFLDAETGWASSGGQASVGSLGGGVFRRGNTESTSISGPFPQPTVGAAILEAPSPNPFSLETRLRFALSQPARVSLVVYDVSGRRMATLDDEKQLESGGYERLLRADALSGGTGLAVPSGVYFVRLLLDGRPAGASQRIVLVR